MESSALRHGSLEQFNIDMRAQRQKGFLHRTTIREQISTLGLIDIVFNNQDTNQSNISGMPFLGLQLDALAPGTTYDSKNRRLVREKSGGKLTPSSNDLPLRTERVQDCRPCRIPEENKDRDKKRHVRLQINVPRAKCRPEVWDYDDYDGDDYYEDVQDFPKGRSPVPLPHYHRIPEAALQQQIADGPEKSPYPLNNDPTQDPTRLVPPLPGRRPGSPSRSRPASLLAAKPVQTPFPSPNSHRPPSRSRPRPRSRSHLVLHPAEPSPPSPDCRRQSRSRPPSRLHVQPTQVLPKYSDHVNAESSRLEPRDPLRRLENPSHFNDYNYGCSRNHQADHGRLDADYAPQEYDQCLDEPNRSSAGQRARQRTPHYDNYGYAEDDDHDHGNLHRNHAPQHYDRFPYAPSPGFMQGGRTVFPNYPTREYCGDYSITSSDSGSEFSRGSSYSSGSDDYYPPQVYRDEHVPLREASGPYRDSYPSRDLTPNYNDTDRVKKGRVRNRIIQLN